jgi:formylglycine-generating enzyme required for sulfatase activity
MRALPGIALWVSLVGLVTTATAHQVLSAFDGCTTTANTKGLWSYGYCEPAKGFAFQRFPANAIDTRALYTGLVWQAPDAPDAWLLRVERTQSTPPGNPMNQRIAEFGDLLLHPSSQHSPVIRWESSITGRVVVRMELALADNRHDTPERRIPLQVRVRERGTGRVTVVWRGAIWGTTYSPRGVGTLRRTLAMRLGDMMEVSVEGAPGPKARQPILRCIVVIEGMTVDARVGERLRNPTDGAKLIWIPNRAFDATSAVDADRVPGFWIYQHEVTARQFVSFVNLARRRLPESDRVSAELSAVGRRADSSPITSVRWSVATAYCQWAMRRLPARLPYGIAKAQCTLRLPTVREWQQVALGIDGRRYPWGEQWVDGVCAMSTPDQRLSGPRLIGTIPTDVSPYGLYDMQGNVAEWCMEDAKSGAGHLVCGYSWQDLAGAPADCLKTTAADSPEGRIGFRCVLVPNPVAR